MTAASKVRNIPLDQLVLSPANVRQTPATAAEDAALEASIRAKGILQNLIVHPTPIDGKGVYEVDAGGCRLKILQKLASEGVINADFKVPCKIEQPEDAVETSLTENTVRAAMHPADEFAAMAALIDSGATIDAVATRFGTSERHVRQRLRLGKLAPELLDAFRAGDISLEVVTAFTLGADHAAQLAVWRQVKANSYIQSYTVKRLLTESAVALDSDLGLFVGHEAYFLDSSDCLFFGNPRFIIEGRIVDILLDFRRGIHLPLRDLFDRKAVGRCRSDVFCHSLCEL